MRRPPGAEDKEDAHAGKSARSESIVSSYKEARQGLMHSKRSSVETFAEVISVELAEGPANEPVPALGAKDGRAADAVQPPSTTVAPATYGALWPPPPDYSPSSVSPQTASRPTVPSQPAAAPPPQAAAAPATTNQVACFNCHRQFGAPAGATIVACPFCKTHNQLAAAT